MKTPVAPSYELWHLKITDRNSANAHRAVWLQFKLLISANGFRQVAEIWAILFDRIETPSGKELVKTAIKQSHELRFFKRSPNALQFGPCEWTDRSCRGELQSKGKIFRWDFQLRPGSMALQAPATEKNPNGGLSFELVPEGLARLGLVRHSTTTLNEDLVVDGWTKLNGQKQDWSAASGMQGHSSGPREDHSWVWGHCNSFVTEQGKPADFIFEGLTARSHWLRVLPAPRLSTFFFFYQGKAFRLNSLWESVRLQSKNTAKEWRFQADCGDLSFRGKARAELKDLIGLTYEDTNSSLLYASASLLSEMEIHVYRGGKLESAFLAPGTACFEVVSRGKNPYVPAVV